MGENLFVIGRLFGFDPFIPIRKNVYRKIAEYAKSEDRTKTRSRKVGLVYRYYVDIDRLKDVKSPGASELMSKLNKLEKRIETHQQRKKLALESVMKKGGRKKKALKK